MRHKVNHIHFVGIGGSGMSGIAEVLLNLGFEVSGSDLGVNTATARLQGLGAVIRQGHDAGHIGQADVVVISSAVSKDNPEVTAARELRIPVVPRAMMLAELMRLKQGIAVAGTHGKTTTTSLTASILAEAGLDPTYVIGGRLNSAGTHAALGKGEFIVAEADESDASFLYLQPVMAVVTNIDLDHMETYGQDFEKLKSAFVDFIEHLPFYGTAVVCLDDPNIQSILPRITKPVVTYGQHPDAEVRAVNIEAHAGRMHFGVEIHPSRQRPDVRHLQIELNLPGIHNVLNALAAITVAIEVGAPYPAMVKALREFHGVGRRFQRFGEIPLNSGGKFTLVDDYGHHPVEMAATLSAARGAFPGRRLVLAFQPHRFTRTRDLFEDFVKILSSVDALFLADVYPAGETPIVAADGRALARAIRLMGRVEPVFVNDPSELPEAILAGLCDGDVVITMGAGSVAQVAPKLSELANKSGVHDA